MHILTALPGLNGFKGLKVEDAKVDITAFEGENFSGFAVIPNPSILSLELGNTTFYNMLDGKTIGELNIDNMQLVPGDNRVALRAKIDQAPVLTALSKRPACETGILDMELIGKEVINKGQNLTYFSEALAQAPQVVPLNVAEALPESVRSSIARCAN